MAAARRADSPSVAPPPEIVGDGVPSGQHWVVRPHDLRQIEPWVFEHYDLLRKAFHEYHNG